MIRVEVAEDGPVERITDVIARGWQLLRRLRDSPRDHSAAVFDFVKDARLVGATEYPDGLSLLSAATPYEGPAGPAYYEALVREDLAALYEIRRRLGQAET